MNYDIFISYKRKSLATANNLYYRLTTRGYSTFFDLEEMRRDDFNEQICTYIKNSKDVFVILEEGSLDACKSADWEKDWFCKEIYFALKEGKNIIPILLNGYQMPDASFFPEELKAFSYKNAPEFSFSFFDEYIDRLIEKDYITSTPKTNTEGLSVFKFYSNADCSVTKDGKLVCSIEGNNDEPYYLPVNRRGEYVFKVENLHTHKIKTIKSTIGAEEEKIVRINWNDKLKWIGGVIAAGLVAALLFFLFSNIRHHDGDDSGVIQPSDSVYYEGECTATVNLMNYNELNPKFDGVFTERLRDIFCYDDSIDADHVTHVFPTSRIFSFDDLDHSLVTDRVVLDSMPYHNAVLRLTMHNKMKKTLIFNRLFLEVADLKYDDTPVCGFNFNGQTITIVNQSERNWDCDFKYALLQRGESFIRYKEHDSRQISDAVVLNTGAGYQLKGCLNDKFHVESNPFGSDSLLMTKPVNYDVVDVPIRNEGTIEINRHNSTKTGVREDFCHSLRTGEPDEEVYFSISSDKPCEFRMRLRIQSTENKSLYTPYVVVKLFKPRKGFLYPINPD